MLKKQPILTPIPSFVRAPTILSPDATPHVTCPYQLFTDETPARLMFGSAKHYEVAMITLGH